MKNHIISTLLLVIPMLSFADVVEIDGICYNLIPKGKVAEVTKKSSGKYTGDIVIPESVTYDNNEYLVSKIGGSAFSSCNGLNSVTIPNSVTSIESRAFKDCNHLTSVTIPNSVVSIGDYAFNNCTSLISAIIPNSVTSIGNYSFSGCGFSSVIIPNSLTKINYAFTECSNLTSVTIPNSVTDIRGAFSRCSSLVSVIIPNSVTNISGAFSRCSRLASVIIPNSVTNISGAFSYCSSLTSVVIPSSVTDVGSETFSYCTSLSSITIPNTVTQIGSYSFRSCSGLTSVHITDLEAWCKITFGIDSNPLSYAHHLFINDEEIKELIIPNTITIINELAFSGCSELTSVTIPSTVNKIGNMAFQGCSSLTSMAIPNSVTTIGQFAFSSCRSLTSVTIPNSVTIIGEYAFSGCNNLLDVYCFADMIPSISSNAFNNSEIEYSTLHVPAKAMDAYMAKTPWSNFGSIVAIEVPKHTLAYTVDGTTYKTYTIEEGETVSAEAEPTKEGYTFSGWSDIPSTMPDHDVTVTGSFTINKYKLTYMVDGEDYISSDVEYGATITPETAPTKEGYTFSGWSEIPMTMPAEDVTISGTFTINKYTITYIIDGEVFKSMEVEYNSVITPPDAPAQDGYDFAWADVPETMPASDITIYGAYTTGISSLSMEESERQVFSPDGKRVETPKKGLNIVRMSDGTVKKVVVK